MMTVSVIETGISIIVIHKIVIKTKKISHLKSYIPLHIFACYQNRKQKKDLKPYAHILNKSNVL